jgi:hypothetical protein
VQRPLFDLGLYEAAGKSLDGYAHPCRVLKSEYPPIGQKPCRDPQRGYAITASPSFTYVTAL